MSDRGCPLHCPRCGAFVVSLRRRLAPDLRADLRCTRCHAEIRVEAIEHGYTVTLAKVDTQTANAVD